MGRGDYLGDLEAMVLAAVVRVGEGANGVRVYGEIEERTGRDVTLPAVHVTLRRLEEKGLARSRLGTPGARGGRPRRYYRATKAGVSALAEFRTMWRGLWQGLDLPEGV